MSAVFDGFSASQEVKQQVPEDNKPTPMQSTLSKQIFDDELRNFEEREKLISFDKNHDGHLDFNAVWAYTKDYEFRCLHDTKGLTSDFKGILDANQDNLLQPDELKVIQDPFIKDTPLGCIDLVHAVKDKNGNITLDGFLKAAASKSSQDNSVEIARRFAEDLMRLYDKNKDGQLDYLDAPTPVATDPKSV